jgi:hypothetical protein
MNPQRQLSPRQERQIRELLNTLAPDFAQTISHQLQQLVKTSGVRNPVAFVRSAVLAVRNGRHGENRGLHISRPKSAATGADRQLIGEGQPHG